MTGVQTCALPICFPVTITNEMGVKCLLMTMYSLEELQEKRIVLVISGLLIIKLTKANYWNGSYTIDSVIDSYNFTVILDGTPNDPVASGIIEYYVDNWSNSLLKCGLFDDQNGLYFEYNGNDLYCVRRSSTLQLSGTVYRDWETDRKSTRLNSSHRL